MGFLLDLKNAAIEAASILRNSADSTNDRKEKRGIKLEVQMVAETYHVLRKRGYDPYNLLLEFHYGSGRNNIFYPDMIYRMREGEPEIPVEFKSISSLPIKNEGSLSKASKNALSEGFEQLLEYVSIDEFDIKNACLVVAYLGTEEGPDSGLFTKLAKEFLGKSNGSDLRKKGIPIEVIAC